MAGAGGVGRELQAIKAANPDLLFLSGYYPEGAPRQMAAIRSSGSRAEGLRRLQIPTLVIHGLDDTLITPGGGERTAELIPSAQLMLVEHMGHDLPEPLWPLLCDALLAHTQSSTV